SRTRRLNSSQLSSRLMYWEGASSARGWFGGGGTDGLRRSSLCGGGGGGGGGWGGYGRGGCAGGTVFCGLGGQAGRGRGTCGGGVCGELKLSGADGGGGAEAASLFPLRAGVVPRTGQPRRRPRAGRPNGCRRGRLLLSGPSRESRTPADRPRRRHRPPGSTG